MHIGSYSYSQYAFMQIVDYNTKDKFCYDRALDIVCPFAMGSLI